MEPNYTFINSVRAYEVKILLADGVDAEELEYTVIADGIVDCAETINERLHALGLTPFALKSIRTLPRIILAGKGLEALGDSIC